MLTGFAALLIFLPKYPFSINYCWVALSSCAMHLLMFLFFRWVTPRVFNIVNIVNFFLLGLSIHFTGGILSPFNMIFPCILVAGSEFGAKYPSVVIAPILCYLVVVFCEYFGFLTPLPVTPSSVYDSTATFSLVVAASVCFMATSGGIYKLTVKALRERLEQENNLKASMMKRLAQLEAPSQIGLLVQKIVHDVRGPLGAISGFVKLMQVNPQTSQASREDCAMMLRELERLSNLMNRMIRYTKPGQEGKSLICPVDLLETVLSVLSFYPGARSISVERNFIDPDTFFIHGNKEELQQVYFNIFKNSFEALEKSNGEKKVAVRMAAKNSNIAIDIVDNGPGMDRSMAGKQIGEVISTKADGAGVGLLIVQEILSGHGGSLRIESERGKGTTIRTWLPLASKS